MKNTLYDKVKSIETNDGVVWAYIRDNKICDQAFMNWKSLYESVISN